MRVRANLLPPRHGYAGSHTGFQGGEEGAEAVKGEPHGHGSRLMDTRLRFSALYNGAIMFSSAASCMAGVRITMELSRSQATAYQGFELIHARQWQIESIVCLYRSREFMLQT